MKTYIIRKSPGGLHPAALLSSGKWDAALVANIDIFAPKGKLDHKPLTTLRMLYDENGLYGRFEAHDNYIRCVAREFQDQVYQDSCVEAFLEPDGNKGYINFEFSGNGTMLSSHIRDPRRTPEGFADFNMLTAEEADGIITAATLPRIVEPEITEPLNWELGFYIPFKVFERRGFSKPEPGTKWRGNFQKCADKTSHPHWASWNELDALDFHLPRCFGDILFE